MLRFTLLASLVLAFGCERRNGAYCDATTPCDPGLSCDLVAHACTDAPLDMSGIPDLMQEGDLAGVDMTLECSPNCKGTTPICQQGTCAPCTATGDPEAACAALDGTKPHCLNAGPDNGACANCRNMTDCADPAKRICDNTTHSCRGCTADTECASLVCDLTPTSANLGRCLPQSSVAYVAGAGACNDANDAKTPLTAVCKPSDGIDKVKNPGGGFNPTTVRFANAIYTDENIVVDNFTITLVGETGATFEPKDANNPALEVKGTNVDLTVRNLRFTAGAGAKGSGIRCEGGTVGKLTVLQSTLYDNNELGIDADTCNDVTIDRCWVGDPPGAGGGNKGGGIRVGGAYRIRNSVIYNNGDNGRVGINTAGVQINSPNTVAVREFVSNTVASNETALGFGGVSCPLINMPTILSSILYLDTSAAAGSETNCQCLYTATSDVGVGAQPNNINLTATPPAFMASDDFHLTAGSPCKDKGPPTGTPAYDYDGKSRPDKTTAKADIGAYELQ